MNSDKLTTLVVGVSKNSDRYANQLVKMLDDRKMGLIAFGKSGGDFLGHKIEQQWNESWKVDTVSLYLRAAHQQDYYDRIIALKPRRVIFNPGTENMDFVELLTQNGIESEIACSLVLLTTGQY